MVASSTFVEPRAASVPAPTSSADCTVQIVRMTDARRAPDVLGVVSGRAVKSPDNTQAWLQAILGGLGGRGLKISFASDAPPGGAVVADVSLRSAWLTSTVTNKTANVVLHIRADRPGADPIDRDYRGAVSVMNWASTTDELQRLVDAAFGGALDNMAIDFRQMCHA